MEFGIRWAGAVRPSWSHFGQVGVFQFWGTTRNKMLQGHNEARVRMSMETRGKENLRPRDSSGCGRSLAKILRKQNGKSKHSNTFG